MLIKLFSGSSKAIVFACFALIALSACILYVPFLDNGLVFDDSNLYKNLSVYQFAITPFNLQPRTFPYFTLGLVQVLYDSIVISRAVSLFLHICCAFSLFLLIRRLLSAAVIHGPNFSGDGNDRTYAVLGIALLVAVWFVVNPVAVYGAAYLVQRTILFATLFSLLCVLYFCRALERNSWPDIVTAAGFYALAVFSKEHAIMLFVAVLPMLGIYQRRVGFDAKKIAVFICLCIPASMIVLMHSGHVVGDSYEPDVKAVLPHGITLLGSQFGQWLISCLAQMGFFFDYFQYWYIPDVRSLSIDMRIDFGEIWLTWPFFLKAILFLVSPFVCLFVLLKRPGIATLFAAGFLYSWIIFFTELVSVRFQEPFVLYRSYIWAPGYGLMFASVLYVFLTSRWRTVGIAVVFIALGCLARERLSSLANEGAAWKDAAAKLQSETISGSGRIFYNRGRQYLREGNLDGAIADFSKTIEQNKNAYYAYYHRGTAYSALSKFEDAEVDFEKALAINDQYGPIYYAKGLLYERMGCLSDAQYFYTEGLKFGVAISQLRLDAIAKEKAVRKEVKDDVHFICHR